jgi:hypothetical protein
MSKFSAAPPANAGRPMTAFVWPDEAARGQDRKAVDDFLRAVVGVAVGSTAAGIAVDDVIVLPIAALALLASRMLTDAPAPPAELAQAWEAVRAGLNDVAMAVSTARAKTKKRPPMDDCLANNRLCYDSRLSAIRGNHPGESVCEDCFARCKHDKVWPSVTWNGKPCEWWSYR